MTRTGGLSRLKAIAGGRFRVGDLEPSGLQLASIAESDAHMLHYFMILRSIGSVLVGSSAPEHVLSATAPTKQHVPASRTSSEKTRISLRMYLGLLELASLLAVHGCASSHVGGVSIWIPVCTC
jgi:hypothetical protein